MPLPRFTKILETELIKELRALGIRAEVGFKTLERTRMFRLYIVSNAFRSMRYNERQDIAWRIVRKHLDEAEMNLISMIVTVTPAEVRDDEEAPALVKPTRRR